MEKQVPLRKPKTKKAKRKVAADEMRKFHHGTLRSGSGAKVTDEAQAKAIAMHVSGQSRYKGRKHKRRLRRVARR